MTFGEKLKEARKLSGLSQEQFAEALHISRSAVAKWENGIGVPDISNLKSISKLLNVSIDCLLDDNVDIEANQILPDIVTDNTYLNDDRIKSCPEYEGYYYTIELTGWNDGVFDVIILGQDKNFLYYQKQVKNKLFYGMIGKKYIVSASKTKAIKNMPKTGDINKRYFVDKHVRLEVAHQDGILKGFFDFRNDDYLDVVIKQFDALAVELAFGHKIDANEVTKIEEL